MKKQSEFGKIKWVDVLNAIYYFVGTLFSLVLMYLQASSKLPSVAEFTAMIGTAALPAFLSIFKSATKNSDGRLLKSESSDVPRTGGGGDVPPPQR